MNILISKCTTDKCLLSSHPTERIGEKIVHSSEKMKIESKISSTMAGKFAAHCKALQNMDFYLQSGHSEITLLDALIKKIHKNVTFLCLFLYCLTSQSTIFQSYMWRHIDMLAVWRRSLTYGRAPTPKTFRRVLYRARPSTDTGPPFLCRLRSIAAHRDHFVRRLSVCPVVTLSW